MSRPKISLVVAMDCHRTIGYKNAMPWPRIVGEQAYFKAITSSKPVVMGRKTFESLPDKVRPLPGRRNVVLTRNVGWRCAGGETVRCVNDVLFLLAHEPEVMVIGGAEIYALFLPLATRLYITDVAGTWRGDAVFPAFDRLDWRVMYEHVGTGEIAHTFRMYER